MPAWILAQAEEKRGQLQADVLGIRRGLRLRSRISQVEQEMVDVRIYQGIHFRTADELGRLHGGRIALWTYINFLRPLPGTR
jgi:hypothetical protein